MGLGWLILVDDWIGFQAAILVKSLRQPENKKTAWDDAKPRFVFFAWNVWSWKPFVCAAVYITKIKLEDDDFNKIMAQITQAPYLENMGQITSLFMYLLAASYLYSEKSREKIISFSAQFNTQLINDLISDVREGKDGKRINLF